MTQSKKPSSGAAGRRPARPSARAERDDKPARGARDDKPARRPAPARGARDDKPARGARDDKPARRPAPARGARDDKPARGARDDKPARRPAPARGARDRDDRPTSRPTGRPAPSRGARDRDDRPTSRPTGRPAPSRGAREDNPARRPAPARGFREDRPAREERPTRARGRELREERPQRPSREERAPLREERPTRRERPERREREGRERAPLLVWGRRPVEAMLADLNAKDGAKLGSYLLYLLADKEGKVPAQLREAVDSAKGIGVRVKVCKGHEDETWPLGDEEGLNHQRICLAIPEFPTASIYEVCKEVAALAAAGAKGCLGVVLDQVQDPRNFGSILRSAAFFGARFAVFGEDRQAAVTSTVVKASAGGAFHLKLTPVVNLNRALAQLKEAGAWIVGSALSDAAVAPSAVPADRAYVLVLGNEGKGMRQEVARNCDFVVRIPGGTTTVDSLNVGVAAGVLLASLPTAILPAAAQAE